MSSCPVVWELDITAQEPVYDSTVYGNNRGNSCEQILQLLGLPTILLAVFLRTADLEDPA